MNIAFSPPDMTEAEVQGAADAIRSGWITTGPKTKELEHKIAEYCQVNRAVCLNSQTACAEMALRLLGIGAENGGSAEDEVIVPAYTYTASASVVCHVGARLVLIDSQKESLEMDYEALENAITENTKAIIPVDLGGVPCDYDRIFSIAEKKNICLRLLTISRKRLEEWQFAQMQPMRSGRNGTAGWWEVLQTCQASHFML